MHSLLAVLYAAFVFFQILPVVLPVSQPLQPPSQIFLPGFPIQVFHSFGDPATLRKLCRLVKLLSFFQQIPAEGFLFFQLPVSLQIILQFLRTLDLLHILSDTGFSSLIKTSQGFFPDLSGNGLDQDLIIVPVYSVQTFPEIHHVLDQFFLFFRSIAYHLVKLRGHHPPVDLHKPMVIQLCPLPQIVPQQFPVPL